MTKQVATNVHWHHADIERDMAQQRARLAARPKDAPLELSATTH